MSSARAGARSAVWADARTFGSADVRGCVHLPLPSRGSAAAGAGAAVRAQPGALSGADVRGGVHLHLLPVDSAAAGAGPRTGAGAAVRADAGALTGAEVRGRVHRALLRVCVPRQPCGQMPGPSPARVWVVACIGSSPSSCERPCPWMERGGDARGDGIGTDEGRTATSRRGCGTVRRALALYPLLSMRTPAPARMLVCRFMAHLRSGPRRGPSRRGRWCARSSSRPRAEGDEDAARGAARRAAVRVDADPVAGSEGGADLHRRALGFRCRRGRCRRPVRPGSPWWCSSPLQPLGSMPMLTPARMFVLVPIARSPGSGGGISRLDRWRVPAPRGCRCSCSLRLLRRGERGLSRWDRPRSPRLRGCGWSCSSRSPPSWWMGSAVGIDPGALPCADAGGGVHRRVASAPRVDHGAGPGADRGGRLHRALPGVSRSGRCRCSCPRGSWSWSSSSPPFQPLPSGSTSQPAPAWMVVFVFIVPSCVSAVRVDVDAVARADGGGGLHLRSVSAPAVGVDVAADTGADRGRGLHPCLRVSPCRRGRSRSRHRRGSWSSSSSLPPGNRAQPSGSMCEPEPERTAVVVRITRLASRWDRCSRPGRRGLSSWWSSRAQPFGSICAPRPARSCVVVFMAASTVGVDGDAAAVRVHAGPGAGAELCRGVHRASSAVGVDAAAVSGAHVRGGVHRCLREGPVSVAGAAAVGRVSRSGRWSCRGRSDRRRTRCPRGDGSWWSSRPQPSGSMTLRPPARAFVVVLIAASVM